MDTVGINVGSGLIATAPVFAAHIVFAKEFRYILLGWFCSFVSTVLLIFCSLSSLFTTNPYVVLAYSIPFDSFGKAILRYFGCKPRFLANPKARLNLGLACGLGFALAHVLTIYLPMVFDQPYSVDFDDDHPAYFPNCLDLACVNHAMSVFQLAVGLLWFRYTRVNGFVMYFLMTVLQYGVAAMSQIPIIAVKVAILAIVSYGLLIFGLRSYRSLDNEYINGGQKDHKE
jgi:hypothetical protein